MKEKYDAVVVLSGGDVETTNKRIEKARKLYLKGLTSFILFNGFNTKEEHDPGFIGDWQDDERLKPYAEWIKLLPESDYEMTYARTTLENAYKTKKLAGEEGWKNIAVVSSETHVHNVALNKKNVGRAPRYFWKFFRPPSHLEFIAVPEPSRELRKKRLVKEHFLDLRTWLFELYGLPRGGEIYDTVEKRRVLFEKFDDTINKYFKF